MRDFLFFLPGFLEKNPKMNLSELSFESLGMAVFNGELTQSVFYGYY